MFVQPCAQYAAMERLRRLAMFFERTCSADGNEFVVAFAELDEQVGGDLAVGSHLLGSGGRGRRAARHVGALRVIGLAGGGRACRG
jgi:hypothetical protein